MRRRKFITLIGGAAAAAWSLKAGAAQQPIPVIGFISNGSSMAYAPFVEAFRQGLRQAGYTEGQNVLIQYRWGENEINKTSDNVAQIVRLPANVIVTSGGDPVAREAKAATKDIPIVATCGSDPVETGLVASIKRPGGNLTCVSVFSVQLVAKRLELAREIVGTSEVIGFLSNPKNPNSNIDIREMEEAARGLRQSIVQLHASNETECDVAFANLIQQSARALIVSSDPYYNNVIEKLVALARRYAVPTIFPRREFSTAGGLVSYGSNLADAYRQLGIYAARVLKGDKPADLPVVLPSRFDLIVNLKTAKSLGIELPTGILLRADEVLE
jgi:putative tryptophan/tyrosine transport system substrate-binding protein